MTNIYANQLGALFLDHNQRLIVFARRLVGADAEDMVQETFIKAHSYLRSGREIRAPLNFLFITLRNLINDTHRKTKLALVDIPTDTAEDETPSIERQAMSGQKLESVCEDIARLPEKMRDAFVLRKVYGYSCSEAAEHLGRSPNTVREQVTQSFKKLQEMQRHG